MTEPRFLRKWLLLFLSQTFLVIVFCAFLSWQVLSPLLIVPLLVVSQTLAWMSLRQSYESDLQDVETRLVELQKIMKPDLIQPDLSQVGINDVSSKINRQLDLLSDQITEKSRSPALTLQTVELHKSLFQSILGTMSEGVIVLDEERRILYFNQSALTMVDADSRRIDGRPIWEVIRHSVLNQVMDLVYQAGGQYRREFEIQRSGRRLEFTAAPIKLAQKVGIVIVFHDVTEIRKMERLRREFISNVSHELKTPLTTIQICAETLLEDDLDDSTQRDKFLSRIMEHSERLRVLIEDMLKLAKIESLADAYSFEPVTVQEILEHSLDIKIPLADANSIELIQEANLGQTQVLADPSGLQTIFDNLMTNAIFYNKTGGRVTISGRCDQHSVYISVADTGIGIQKEHLSRIFERFYRVDKARSITQGGTGLGLAIVKHLTIVFQGEVRVESTPGQGTVFTVKLPILKNNHPQESKNPPATSGHTPSAT